MFKTPIKRLYIGLAIAMLMGCTDTGSVNNALLHAGYADGFYKAKNYTKAIEACAQAITYMEQGVSTSLNLSFGSKTKDAVLCLKAFCHTLSADSYSYLDARDKAVEQLIMANVEWEQFLKHNPDQLKMVDDKGDSGVSVRDVFKKLDVTPQF